MSSEITIIMQTYSKRFLITFTILLFPICCTSTQQEEGKVSLISSLDYGLGKDFNNYATTIHLYYNIFSKIRIAPSFSYFFNKRNMKMRTFTFNCHYLFPDAASNYFKVLKNQGICFYPITGFLVSGIANNKKECYSCDVFEIPKSEKFSYNFGFNFGAGVDYEIPTMLPLLREMKMNIEIKYQTLDNYRRPLISFGILYEL